MMRDRHAQQLILDPSSKFVGYDSELQLLRRRVENNTTIYLRYAARALLGREQLVCLKMMRDRHAQQLILVLSSKFVGYDSVDADDEAEGLEAPYINQSKWMDYATLEASHIPDEITRYIENDNLADIKLKLTCTNSIAAMNIYSQLQKKRHPIKNGYL